jgi:hypothetical protein
MNIIRQTGWGGLLTLCHAPIVTVGMSCVTAAAHAAFEAPEGERITPIAVVARAIPDKEAYELYDPKIGKNFDINKFGSS